MFKSKKFNRILLLVFFVNASCAGYSSKVLNDKGVLSFDFYNNQLFFINSHGNIYKVKGNTKELVQEHHIKNVSGQTVNWFKMFFFKRQYFVGDRENDITIYAENGQKHNIANSAIHETFYADNKGVIFTRYNSGKNMFSFYDVDKNRETIIINNIQWFIGKKQYTIRSLIRVKNYYYFIVLGEPGIYRLDTKKKQIEKANFIDESIKNRKIYIMSPLVKNVFALIILCKNNNFLYLLNSDLKLKKKVKAGILSPNRNAFISCIRIDENHVYLSDFYSGIYRYDL